MAGFGRTFRQALNNHVFRNATSPMNGITNIYISLHTADPGVDGQTAGEVSTGGGSNYTRQAMLISTPTWSSATGAEPSETNNIGAVTWSAAGTNWGTITHFGVWKTTSSGTTDFIGANALNASQAVGIGNTASFAATALKHTLAG